MTELQVKLNVRKNDGKEVWSATASVPGFRPTKVQSKSTKATTFSSRAAALAVARNNAKAFGFKGVNVTNQEALKKAAKVSLKKKTKTVAKTVVATPVVGTPATTTQN
jgi:precorrin-6B methylase 2